MDLINNRTKDIASMALDGLYERSKAISANTVNALTPNYQRKEVSFEQSLKGIIQKENEKEEMKLQNSLEYQKNPSSILKGQDIAKLSFLNSDTGKDFFIDVEVDSQEPLDDNNNNVNLEKEMMDEAKTGMQYQIVANLLSKSYTQLASVIKGQN